MKNGSLKQEAFSLLYIGRRVGDDVVFVARNGVARLGVNVKYIRVRRELIDDRFFGDVLLEYLVNNERDAELGSLNEVGHKDIANGFAAVVVWLCICHATVHKITRDVRNVQLL